MPVTGIFFLPSPTTSTNTTSPPPLQTLLTRLTTTYTLTPLPRWTLSHQLFRSTPSIPIPPPTSPIPTPPKPTGLRYLHILTLSHRPSTTSILITAPQAPSASTNTPASSPSAIPPTTKAEAATVIAIPPGAQSEEFTALLSSKLNPLWQQRHSIQVQNGQGFEVGDFRVRVGEVRQGMGGAIQGRGVVVELEYLGGGEEGEEDWDTAESAIRAFWAGLGVPGAREFIRIQGVEEGWGVIRQWCEVLRMRG